MAYNYIDADWKEALSDFENGDDKKIKKLLRSFNNLYTPEFSDEIFHFAEDVVEIAAIQKNEDVDVQLLQFAEKMDENGCKIIQQLVMERTQTPTGCLEAMKCAVKHGNCVEAAAGVAKFVSGNKNFSVAVRALESLFDESLGTEEHRAKTRSDLFDRIDVIVRDEIQMYETPFWFKSKKWNETQFDSDDYDDYCELKKKNKKLEKRKR